MKKNIVFTAILFLFFIKVNAQEFNKNINKDSLFNVVVNYFPEEMRKEITKTYNEGNESSKEFLLMMFSLPRSSKKELIQNYENNEKNITLLKTEYLKLVPKDFVVNIEFEKENIVINMPESVNIRIYQKNKTKKVNESNLVQRADNLEQIYYGSNLAGNSTELLDNIKILGWTKETLITIKKLIDNANCISIENQKITEVGFARSGMGKYYYKIFDNNLTEKQQDEYNDMCTYIYYKQNIVLYYGSGAFGQFCFEKHDE